MVFHNTQGVDCKADSLVGNGARLPQRGQGSCAWPLRWEGREALGEDRGAAQPSAANPGRAVDVSENRDAGAEESPVQGAQAAALPQQHTEPGCSGRGAPRHPAGLPIPALVQLPCSSLVCERGEGEIRAGDGQTAAQESVG